MARITTATTVTVTVTCTPQGLMALVSGAVKGVSLVGMATTATPVAPPTPKVYDSSTCESVPMGNLSTTLKALAGPGMLERVKTTLGIDYSLATTLVSAESAARKAQRDTLYVVPAKADAIRAIIAKL